VRSVFGGFLDCVVGGCEIYYTITQITRPVFHDRKNDYFCHKMHKVQYPVSNGVFRTRTVYAWAGNMVICYIIEPSSFHYNHSGHGEPTHLPHYSTRCPYRA